MNYAQARTYEKRARATTATWDGEYGHQPRFAELAVAMLPASLILAAATALLVVLI
ncbi:hypothetical protein [Devosia sediminis]|uniref:Uncharacterized protein n=1 Tax=Devosia sediminis TaxID=2798801 RepID=A0A934IVV8_9HYPH|nr:hypothetical protein [Devosia sediminis]MBJ3783267.1 hypothetical protein [Devosia sediminis]